MILEALNIPVWKTRAYILPIESIFGVYQIYLKRLGVFYMRNEKGIVIKFRTQSAIEESFYDKAYKEKKSISVDVGVLIK